MFDFMDNIDDREKNCNMKYQYMKFNNGMNITHSATYRKDGLKCVDVYFEIASKEHGLNSCCISLPTLDVKERVGFGDEEVKKLKDFAKHDASAFFEFGDEEAIEQTNK